MPCCCVARPASGQSIAWTMAGTPDKAGTLAPRPGGGLSEADKIARYGAPGQSSTVTVRTTLRSATASVTAVTAVRVGTDVGVDIPAGALSGTVDVTVKRLTSRDMPPLDPGLVNVTAPDANGFQFLPHGQKFLRPVDVLLPFDPALLPP